MTGHGRGAPPCDHVPPPHLGVPFSPPRNQSTGPQGMTKYSHTRKLTGGMEPAQGHTVGRRREALGAPWEWGSSPAPGHGWHRLVTAELKTLPPRVTKSTSLSQKDQGSNGGFATDSLCDLKTLPLCVHFLICTKC